MTFSMGKSSTQKKSHHHTPYAKNLQQLFANAMVKKKWQYGTAHFPLLHFLSVCLS